MANNVYECMFILDANRYARDPSGVSGQIPAMIEKCGGEILASRLWNEQRLAYMINGQRKGAYWLTYFRMEADQVAVFNRACRLSGTILRNLTLKIEPRLANALVAHARGETPVVEEELPPDAAPAVSDEKAAEASQKPAAEASDGAPADDAPEVSKAD